MKQYRIAIFAVVFTLALLAGTLVAEAAEDRPDSGDKPEGRRQGRRRRGRSGVSVKIPDIGLTDEQKKEIDGIVKAATAAAKDAKGEDRTAIMVKMRKDIYKLYTKEQRQKLQKIRQAGGAGGGGKPVDMRLEIVTFPPNVQAGFKDLSKQALFYHPIKKPEDKVPLIVLLHGAGGTKKKDITAFKGNRDVTWVMTPANSKYVAKVLVPHSRSLWDPASLNKMLDYILSTNSDIDTDRIYCIGYSMGGKGAWDWAMTSPKRLAAIVPVAFIANQGKLKDMVDLPIWAMVGTADRRRAGGIPKMEKALKDLGSKVVRTTVFQGANHATSAAKAWAQEGLLKWLFAQSLKNRGAGAERKSQTVESKK
jgi:predicted esterase/Spy/CpxP family protein refolding chaperone